MNKLYFESVDSNECCPLEYFLNQARIEGEDEITLIEACPTKEKEYCWCLLIDTTIERSECRKSKCDEYKKPLKGNACGYRGKLCDCEDFAVLENFAKRMLEDVPVIDENIQKVINENFWDML